MFDLLGAQSAATQIAPLAQNPKGFFESRPVARANDRLLEQAGQVWHHPRMISPDWLAGEEAIAFGEGGYELLNDEFGGRDQIILKDPRIARLFPVWAPILVAAEYEVCVVCTFRHPREVSFSLRDRNKFPPSHGYVLWAVDLLQAEIGSRGFNRDFSSFDQLLDDPVKLMTRLGQELGISFEKRPRDLKRQFTEFLDTSLRHHQATNVPMRPLFTELVSIFSRWAAWGENGADHARLDYLREEIASQTEAAFATEDPDYEELYQAVADIGSGSARAS